MGCLAALIASLLCKNNVQTIKNKVNLAKLDANWPPAAAKNLLHSAGHDKRSIQWNSNRATD